MKALRNTASGGFTQSGGTNSVHNGVFVDNTTGGTGSYALSGSGMLAAFTCT